MSELASQIVAAKMQQLNTKLNTKMQEISGKTGIQFSEMFASRLNSIAQEQDKTSDIDDMSSVEGEEVTSAASTSRGNYDALISAMATKYGVEPQLARAVVWAESNFNVNAVSKAGAVGLMQLMPGTAEMLGVTDSYDPVQNVDGGVRYLAQRIEQYGGDVLKALAAYNCGPARIASIGVDDLTDSEQFSLLPKETQNYITRIEGYLESMGMSNILA